MRTFLLFLAIALGPPQMLSADLIVNFGGPYVDKTVPLAGNAFIGNGIDIDGDALNDDEIGGRAFSSSSPLSPLTDYSGTSSRFYGGMILGKQDYSVGNTAFDKAEIENQADHDSVHLHASHGSEVHNLHAAFLWQQADFLSGGGPTSFNLSSFATFAIGSSATENLNGAQVRLLVRDDLNNYWLSETAFTSPNANSSFTWDNSNQGFSATSDGKWASYDPTTAFAGLGAGTDLRFDETGTFSDMKFNSITGVGFFFEQDTFHNNLDFHFESFQVNAVPEPTSLAVVAVCGLFTASRFRRRRAGI